MQSIYFISISDNILPCIFKPNWLTLLIENKTIEIQTDKQQKCLEIPSLLHRRDPSIHIYLTFQRDLWIYHATMKFS